MTTRNQHYVWRHYLESWQNEKGQVHWSREGAILHPTKPKNVMVERDFYKLPRISETDFEFLRDFALLAGLEPLRESHRNLVDQLAYVSAADELIQNSNRVSTDDKRETLSIVIRILDDVQTQIEEEADPLLEELRQGRTEFTKDYESAMAFFRFIAHQYFRTKRIRESFERVLSQTSPDHDFGHLANVVSHIGAENVGASLFVDRNEFDIIFLESKGNIEFITGDQPVVNLLGTGDGSETTELALYYPISPVLACLLVPSNLKLSATDIPDAIVKQFNDLIAWESRHFLVASSDRVLQGILSKPSSQNRPSLTILDFLVEISERTCSCS